MNIVAVQFQSKNNPEGFSGQEHTYYSNVTLAEGDVIYAPVKTGRSVVRVSRIGVKDSEISERVRPFMRTIETLERPEQPTEPEGGEQE